MYENRSKHVSMRTSGATNLLRDELIVERTFEGANFLLYFELFLSKHILFQKKQFIANEHKAYEKAL